MRRSSWRSLALLSIAALSLGFIAACGGGDEDDGEGAANGNSAAGGSGGSGGGASAAETGTVEVELSEWAVTVDPASAPAGEVSINGKNGGSVAHRLLVIRSDQAPDALPVADGQVDVSQVDVVGEIPTFPPGWQRPLTVQLEAGSYVLICNIPEHYEQGMRTGFTVE